MCLALAGLNRQKAADLAGVSVATFYRLMRTYRVKAPRCDAKLSPADVDEIRQLLKEHSQRKVAEIMKIHRRTVEKVSGCY